LNLAVSLLTESDSYPRQSAVNFVCKYATSEQFPALLKLLKDPDFSVRQNTLKAIGRLNDEHAIAPLVDLIARGGQMNQMPQDITACLVAFGPAAEDAVLGLLSERNSDTRRQACTLLQQIGTDKSLEPLQKQVGDPDQSVSQAAVDAIRAIKSRQ
jgi:HEAT repeat protein